MVIILQLILYTLVGLSSVCFGMQQAIETWDIDRIEACNFTANHYTQRWSPGKLEIYYERNGDNNYTPAARLKPDDQEKPILKFNNFDSEKYKEVKRLGHLLGSKSKTSVPLLYIVKAGKQEESPQAVGIMKIEDTNEPEEWLDLGKVFVKRWGDYITLEEDNKKPISLYKAETIRNIYQALLKGQPFSIRLQSENGDDECFIKKVKDFEIATPFGWDGWALLFMPVSLNPFLEMSFLKGKKLELEVITVNLKDEQESYYYYQINKWIARGLMTAVMLLIVYQLKNKIYNMGSFLLQ